VRQTRRQK